MTIIRTKWHHILPLIEKDEVYLTAPKGGKSKHYSEYGLKIPVLKRFLSDLENLPHFVVDKELLMLATKGEFTESMLDMKQAGVLRLPFSAMVVEFKFDGSESTRSHHSIVMLRDLHATSDRYHWENAEDLRHLQDKEKYDFYGIRMSVEADKDGEYFVLSPCVIHQQINDVNDVPPAERLTAVITDKKSMKDRSWIKMYPSSLALMPDSPKNEELISAVWKKDGGTCFYAASAAYLLMNTEGVAKEVIDTERINKQRKKNGKTIIPEYTYLHIGRVYRSDKSEQSDEYIARRSPRPHWRRGHIRRVRYGAGRALLKQHFFPAKLVAYHGDHTPKSPDYIVTK